MKAHWISTARLAMAGLALGVSLGIMGCGNDDSGSSSSPPVGVGKNSRSGFRPRAESAATGNPGVDYSTFQTEGKEETATCPNDDPDHNTSYDSVPKIIEKCGQGDILTVVRKLYFPNPGKVCDFDKDGNQSRLEEYVKARREQKLSLEVPGGGVICGMNFTFPQQTMLYDDEIFFTFNDAILVSSTDRSHLFEKKEDYFNFNWEKLLGSNYVRNDKGTYCLGADQGKGNCTLPPTENPGTMQFTFDETVALGLSALAEKEKRRDFNFITTGDNNDTDCQHSDFRVNVELQYVPR